MALGAPSKTPYEAVLLKNGDWWVKQKGGKPICKLSGENAASNAHFIANACNASEHFIIAANMALLVLDDVEQHAECEALKEARAIARGEH